MPRKKKTEISVNGKTYVEKVDTISKKRNSYTRDILSPNGGLSSKRFTGIFMILISVVGLFFDSLGMIKLSENISISLIAGGVSLLLGGIADKFQRPYTYTNGYSEPIVYDGDDINDREDTSE